MGCAGSKPAVAAASPAPMADADPPDLGHLMLGITLEGLVEFCKEIKFPLEGIVGGINRDSYDSSYMRTADMAWVDEVCGKPDDNERQDFHRNLVGYDFGAAIRHFLLGETWHPGYGEWQKTGEDQSDKSVCEVLLARGDDFTYLATSMVGFGRNRRMESTPVPGACARHVGKANVFYSHVQRKTLRRTIECMQRGRDVHRGNLPASDGATFYWLDYAVLRQCQRDFEPRRIVQAIKEIGVTLVELDAQPQQYLTRSFCILETFATVDGGSRLCVFLSYVQAVKMAAELAAHPVDAKLAMTWREEDKSMIDGYIEASVGFAALNRIVGGAMVDGAAAAAKLAREQPRIDLANCGLTVADAAIVADLLSASSHLTELDLSGNDAISTDGAAAIAAGAADCKQLASLTLETGKPLPVSTLKADGPSLNLCGDPWAAQAGFGPLSAVVIATLAASNSSLRDVDLSNNDFGDDGATALADVFLAKQQQLRTLKLAFNKVGVLGARALARLCAEGSTLTALDLGQNAIGDEGAAAFARALSDHAENQLQSLDLIGNGISIDGYAALTTFIESSSCNLTHLILTGNKFAPEAKATLQSAATARRSDLKVVF